MEKKKFSIELPKGGMSNLAKQTSLQTTPRAISECYSSKTYQSMVSASGY